MSLPGKLQDKIKDGLNAKPEEQFKKIISPFESFIQHEITGSAFLILCTLLAIVVANSSWSEEYLELIHFRLGIVAQDWQFDMTIKHWVNDGLMALFFFVLGLEIKQEMLVGELKDKSLAIPVVAAAIGGMLVPALIYSGINWGEISVRGWGISMATDAAFAVGILALLRKHIPSSLLTYLTALAIIDDIGAVLVIAIFYTESIQINYLIWSGGLFLFLILANTLGVRRSAFYIIAGLLLWVAMLNSGVHASISGILIALTIPARTSKKPENLSKIITPTLKKLNKRIDKVDGDGVLSDELQHQLIQQIQTHTKETTTPLQRWAHFIEQPVTLLILPIFALVNAGIILNPAMFPEMAGSKIVWGVMLGLVLGKSLGISFFCWLSLRFGIGRLPEGMNFSHVIGVSLLGGVGFTMSIFVAGLAFGEDLESINNAKSAILFASLIAGIGGYLWLRFVASQK